MRFGWNTNGRWGIWGRCAAVDPAVAGAGLSGLPGAVMVVMEKPRGSASMWIKEARMAALSTIVWPATDAVIAQGLFSMPRVSIDACSNMGGYLPFAGNLDIRPVLFCLDSAPERFVPVRLAEMQID